MKHSANLWQNQASNQQQWTWHNTWIDIIIIVHDVRFVWLKVQSDTEWNSHWNIPMYQDYFWTAKRDFPEKEGKGQQVES